MKSELQKVQYSNVSGIQRASIQVPTVRVVFRCLMMGMILPGRMTAIAAIPVPDLAVPYAAPIALKIMADDAPITPKNGE